MLSVELFEDDGVALVVVPDYQLSLAIGREGQNVRLAARLTGWRLDIASETEAAEARERYLAERSRARPLPNRREPLKLPKQPCREAEQEIDAELIRKLEEFRRERLGTDGT